MTTGGAALRRPTLCLVTDRLGFAAFLGRPEDPAARLVEQVGLAAEAGVDLVHVRERDLQARELAGLVRRLVARVRGRSTLLVVNDRLDVALAAGADGVHLRGDSIPTAAARAAAPRGFLIGRSVRSAEQARAEAEAGADYVVLGTIFPTPSKPDGSTLVGLDELARAAAASPRPVLAIGGMSGERLGEVAAARAAGFAAIRLFWDAGLDPGAFGRLVGRCRRPFDLDRAIS